MDTILDKETCTEFSKPYQLGRKRMKIWCSEDTILKRHFPLSLWLYNLDNKAVFNKCVSVFKESEYKNRRLLTCFSMIKIITCHLQGRNPRLQLTMYTLKGRSQPQAQGVLATWLYGLWPEGKCSCIKCSIWKDKNGPIWNVLVPNVSSFLDSIL